MSKGGLEPPFFDVKEGLQSCRCGCAFPGAIEPSDGSAFAYLCGQARGIWATAKDVKKVGTVERVMNHSEGLCAGYVFNLHLLPD